MLDVDGSQVTGDEVDAAPTATETATATTTTGNRGAETATQNRNGLQICSFND